MSPLRRLPASRYSIVEPVWSGDTVVIIAGGPSLTHEQVLLVQRAHAAGRVRCVVVNDAYLLAPFADVLYFADSHWWKWHTEGIPKPSLGMTAEQVVAAFRAFAGVRCTIKNSGANVTDDNVHMLLNATIGNPRLGLSSEPTALVTGRHSGFQALNLSVLAGAVRVLLLGFDARASQNKTHWFGEHPRPTNPSIYAEIKKSFSMAEKLLKAAQVDVVNCSPGTAIDSFPKSTIAEALG